MSVKQAAWIHGCSVQLEDVSWAALRQEGGTYVRPSSTTTTGWVHFPIPTPSIADGFRLKAVSSFVRFSTGPRASIVSYHVNDGEKSILSQDVSYSGGLQTVQVDVSGSPSISWGTSISLQVKFDGNGPDAWIQLVSAGIDFSS